MEAMQTDTKVSSAGTKNNGRRKCAARLFKCLRKPDLKDENTETKTSNHEDESTLTESNPKDREDQTAAGSESEKQSEIKRKSHMEGSSSRERRRCQKCHRKKRDKDSDRHRMDKRYCRCRRGGYCNTNTIVFPNDYKSNSTDMKELQYLQLIKEIAKDETTKNPSELCEIRREIDRQREEIKELKTLLLQNLLEKKSSEKDSKVTYPEQSNLTRRRSVDSLSLGTKQSQRPGGSTTPRKKQLGKGKTLVDSEHSMLPFNPQGTDITSFDSGFKPVGKSVSGYVRSKAKKPSLWARLFGKKK